MDERNRRRTNPSPTDRTRRAPSNKRPSGTPAGRGAQRSPASREPMSRDEVRKAKYLERRRKRRRNKLISYCVGALLVLIVAVIIVISVFFKISSIKITGDEIYSQEEIITASGLKVGDNMFAFNKSGVCSEVETRLPYVEKLSVKRSPTGKVTLNVQAATAVMAVESGEEYVLLNASCKVLEEHALELKEGAAWVKCSPVKSAVSGTSLELERAEDIKMLTDIAGLIRDSSLKKITGINILDYSYIKLNYDNRINLKVGSFGTFRDNIDFIRATLERQDEEEPSFTGAIDFTITDRAFVNAVDEDETTTVPAEAATDENGEYVTDENGAYVTEAQTEAEAESTTSQQEETTKKKAA